MNVNHIKRGCIVFFIAISLFFAADWTTLYCQVNSVNVRTKPNTTSTILGTLSTNEPIVPTGETENWYRISYQNQDAWVYKAFFSEEKIQTATYWYNSNSGVLHNSNCRWFGNTKKGYYTNDVIGRDCGLCGGAYRGKPQTGYKYWINTNSGVRHNRGCRWYGNTKNGYYTNEKVGRACGICGG